MQITLTNPVISIRRKMAENAIEFLKIYGFIKPMQWFSNKKHYHQKLEYMRSLPEGTVGFDIARILDKNDLELIPLFEEHDLKHLLLGYEMTTIEELRLQAYLFGNGNYSIFCVLFLATGLFLPSQWNTFYQDYQRGKLGNDILSLKIDESMLKKTESLKRLYQ